MLRTDCKGIPLASFDRDRGCREVQPWCTRQHTRINTTMGVGTREPFAAVRGAHLTGLQRTPPSSGAVDLCDGYVRRERRKSKRSVRARVQDELGK